MCQKIKNKTEILVKKLKLSKVLEKLKVHLIMNFIINLPLVAGNNAILVVCNILWQPLVTKTNDYTASKSLKWI